MATVQQVSETSRTGHQLELTILSFIVGLIVKSALDNVFSNDVMASDGIRALFTLLWNCNTLAFAAFFFALLRFMYGAWRLHEESRDAPSSNRTMTLWNVFMMIAVFLTFYAAGLAIKPHPLMFYKLFALAHFVNFIWFSPLTVLPLRKRLPETVCKASRNFVFLDLITIFWSFLWLSRWYCWSPFIWRPWNWGSGINMVIAGYGMLAIGVLDIGMNLGLYFPWDKRSSTPPADLPSTSKGAVGLLKKWRNALRRVRFLSFLRATTKRGSPVKAFFNSPTIYLAAPLFTHAEWQWNATLVNSLKKAGYTVIAPQENVAEMLLGTKPFDPAAVFSANVKAIEQCKCVVAVLDGSDCDSGTCWECGCAYNAGIPVIGLRTDIRGESGDTGETVNLMLTESCTKMVSVPRANRANREAVVAALIQAIRCVIHETAGSAHGDS